MACQRLLRWARTHHPVRVPVVTYAVAWIVACCMAWSVADAQVQTEVRGRVTGSLDDAGVAEATIEDAGGEATVLADGGGVFVLRGLTPGVHTLRVTAVGFRPTTVTVSVENGRTVQANVALTPVAVGLASVTVRAAADPLLAGATTITHADIVASGRRDVADLLDQVPGVVVMRQGGPAGTATLSLRGSNANEVLVLVDGVPLNSPLTGEADLSQIPIASIERIIVIPGAQSARYGSRALAGVVLIETRQPTGPAFEAQTSAGAWGDADGSLSVGAGSSASVSGRVTAERRTSVGDFPFNQLAVRGGGTAVRLNDEVGTTSFNGAMRVPAGPLSIALRATEVDGARGLPSSIVAQDTTGHAATSRTAGGVTVREDVGRLSWSADFAVDHEHETDVDSTPTFGGPPYDNHISATSLDSRAAATLALPGALHDVALTTGAEVRTLEVIASALSDSAPGNEYEDGIWAALRAARGISALRATLDATVRADWASLVSGVTVSPHVDLALADGPVVALVGGGQSFSPPTLADEFFQEGVLVKPNPDLQPELVRDEIEGRLAVHDVGSETVHASAEVAVYQADVSGMILWFPSFQFVWSPENQDVHRSGWDASGDLALGHVGLTVRGAVSDVAVEYAGPVLDGQVAYRPRVTGDAGARFVRGRFTADWSSRYIGERRTVQGSALNSLPPYWISDAMLTLRVVTGAWPVAVFGGVDDVFDRQADLLVDYPYAGRSWFIGVRLRSAGPGRI